MVVHLVVHPVLDFQVVPVHSQVLVAVPVQQLK
jgi:hypothetical protein